MKNKLFYLMSLLVILALAASTSSTEAHGVRTEVVSAQKVHFKYDDGSPLKEAAVSVKDATGKEIGSGKTDATGHFDFSAFPDAKTIEATDLMGHHGVCSTDTKVTSSHSAHDHSHAAHDHADHDHSAHDHADHDHADHDHADHDHADHDHAAHSHKEQSFTISTLIITVLVILAVIAAGFSFGKKSNGQRNG